MNMYKKRYSLIFLLCMLFASQLTLLANAVIYLAPREGDRIMLDKQVAENQSRFLRDMLEDCEDDETPVIPVDRFEFVTLNRIAQLMELAEEFQGQYNLLYQLRGSIRQMGLDRQDNRQELSALFDAADFFGNQDILRAISTLLAGEATEPYPGGRGSEIVNILDLPECQFRYIFEPYVREYNQDMSGSRR